MTRRASLSALTLGAVSLALALRAGSQVPPTEGAPEAPPPRPYDHVVIVSFDGMRPDGMAQANAPTLRRMVAEGANALAAETVGDSSTLPSHSSMLTGVEVREHGMTFDDFRPHRGFIRVPTVLYRAHDAGFATAMFVAKSKLRHIAVPGSLDVWSLPSWRCDRVASAAAEYLARSPAGITFIHFGEPDGAGHRHRWMSAEYLEAIARSDACLATVMAALEARADRHRVLVMISADHGGHGRRHGSHDPQDLHIPWIAWGARVQRGDFSEPVRTTDTGVTALAALGLPVPPELTGRAITRAWAVDPTTDDDGGTAPRDAAAD
jgi:arylsulfatase A-like enzyme